MDSVSTCCQKLPASIKTVPGDWAYQSAQFEATAIAGAQNTDIQIQTTDGDKVTLSSDITFEAAAVTYQGLSRTSTSYSDSQGRLLSASASRNLELTIEGQLDAQEQKEVKTVLMGLFEMINDFVSGNGPTGEKQFFADLTAISEVKAEVNISTRLTVAAQATAKYTSEAPLLAKPAVTDPVDKLTDRMIKVVEESSVEPSKILNRLNRRITRLSDPFKNAGPAVWHGMRLRKKILENLVAKLQNWMAKNETETGFEKQTADKKAAIPDYFVSVETTAAFSQTALSAARQDIHLAFEYSVADQHPA